MQTVFDIYNFIVANWVQIGVAIGYIVAAARVIVAITPTVEDDHRLAYVVSILKKIGLHVE